MRILLTAFEPFDGTGLNASLEGCRYLLQHLAPTADLRFAVLPVDYGPDTEAVDRALAEAPADVLLHTGQAHGADRMRIERLAVNVRYAEGSDTPCGKPQCLIDPEGPPALFSTVPVDEMAAAMAEEGVPAAVSNHAGIYLCNHVLYQSLRRHGSVRVGFVHVPRLPEQVAPGEPSLTAEQIGRGLQAAVECLLRLSSGV